MGADLGEITLSDPTEDELKAGGVGAIPKLQMPGLKGQALTDFNTAGNAITLGRQDTQKNFAKLIKDTYPGISPAETRNLIGQMGTMGNQYLGKQKAIQNPNQQQQGGQQQSGLPPGSANWDDQQKQEYNDWLAHQQRVDANVRAGRGTHAASMSGRQRPNYGGMSFVK